MRTALCVFALAGLAFAQEPANPVFRVTVTSRTIRAFNFNHRQGTTKVDLHGTPLLPDARGEVRVQSNTGATKMHVDVTHLTPASQFGPEFLTYVLWAISPQGNAKNLGEIVVKKDAGDHAMIDATTDLQSFGLIVTAEPYWAVSEPSDAVVMENFVRNDTVGTIEQVDAKYELLQRGTYTVNISPDRLRPITLNETVPLQLREARSAVAIARATGADHYAADTMRKAMDDLQNAEGYLVGGRGVKPLETAAREATQMAEDARLISIRRMRDEQLATERRQAADMTADAQARARAAQASAEDEAQRRAHAEAEQRAADMARQQADLARQQAEAAAANASAAAARERAEAGRVRAEADAARLAAEADANKARLAAQAAEAEKNELRTKLQQQLNTILETRDTARGLIVNMNDVLFDFNKATLKPAFREKLAKLSGIILAYPSLHLAFEGHTDSIGSDAYNQTLSEKRAFAVRDYLVAQGINGNNVTATGMGKANPVASNDNDAGRAQNRRVELIVSGDIIGNPIGSPTSLR
ncbi:MAG TPA: flagellar motor protein MotB [Solibacterales bacterium]|nr:flagellar motor protein MotB [Bryobacterales bacterium]